MSLDLAADLTVFFNEDDFAVPVLLWPGTAQERRISGIFDASYLGVTEGGQVIMASGNPVLLVKSEDVEELAQGDSLRVPPAPARCVAGGDFRVANPQPDGNGCTLLELHRA